MHNALLPTSERMSMELPSCFDHHSHWLFDRLLDAPQEGGGVSAVKDAMIVGQGYIHHGANNHLAAACHRPLLDCVHSKHAALRRVDKWRGEQRPINASVADGECSPLEFVRLELVLLRPMSEVVNRLLDFGEAHALGVPQDGHNEAAIGADGDADVIVVAVSDIG